MTTATLTSKGQTTIPKAIRDRLRLKPGDRLEFVVQPDGRVLMIPAVLDIADLKGILPRPKRRLSLAEMDEAIRGAAADPARRGR